MANGKGKWKVFRILARKDPNKQAVQNAAAKDQWDKRLAACESQLKVLQQKHPKSTAWSSLETAIKNAKAKVGSKKGEERYDKGLEVLAAYQHSFGDEETWMEGLDARCEKEKNLPPTDRGPFSEASAAFDKLAQLYRAFNLNEGDLKAFRDGLANPGNAAALQALKASIEKKHADTESALKQRNEDLGKRQDNVAKRLESEELSAFDLAEFQETLRIANAFRDNQYYKDAEDTLKQLEGQLATRLAAVGKDKAAFEKRAKEVGDAIVVLSKFRDVGLQENWLREIRDNVKSGTISYQDGVAELKFVNNSVDKLLAPVKPPAGTKPEDHKAKLAADLAKFAQKVRKAIDDDLAAATANLDKFLQQNATETAIVDTAKQELKAVEAEFKRRETAALLEADYGNLQELHNRIAAAGDPQAAVKARADEAVAQKDNAAFEKQRALVAKQLGIWRAMGIDDEYHQVLAQYEACLSQKPLDPKQMEALLAPATAGVGKADKKREQAYVELNERLRNTEITVMRKVLWYSEVRGQKEVSEFEAHVAQNMRSLLADMKKVAILPGNATTPVFMTMSQQLRQLESAVNAPPADLGKQTKTYDAIRQKLDSDVLKKYRKEERSELKQELAQLLGVLGFETPDGQVEKLEALQKKVDEALRDAAAAETSAKDVDSRIDAIKKDVESLKDHPLYRKDLKGRLETIKANVKIPGRETEASADLAQLEGELKLAKNTGGLAAKESALEAARDEEWRRAARWKILRGEFEANHLKKAEDAKKTVEKPDKDGYAELDAAFKQAEKLADAKDFDGAERALARAKARAGELARNPQGRRVALKTKLPALRERWNSAVVAFNQSVEQLAAAVQGETGLDAKLIGDAAAEIRSARATFSAAAFDAIVAAVENEADQGAKALREQGLATVRANMNRLNKDPLNPLLLSNPFGVSVGLTELNTVLANLELNLLQLS